jgi:hypothetical protein
MDMKSFVRSAMVALLSVALVHVGEAAPPRREAPVAKPSAAHAAASPKVTALRPCVNIAVTALTVTLNEGGRVATAREAGFDRVRVTALVRDTTATAPVLHGAFRLAFFRDGQAIGEREFTVTADPTPVSLDDKFVHGAQPSHVYRAVVSSADNECRANNNEKSTTVTEAGLHPLKAHLAERPVGAPPLVLPTKPDLRVDRLWLAERPDGTGELAATSPLMFQKQVYLGCAYSNAGTDVTKQFLLGVFDNGPLIHKEWVAGLASGASGQVVVPFPAHAVQGTAWCIVDWGRQVDEANEDNNRMDRSYAPPRCSPDLKVDSAFIDGPTTVALGDTIRFVCEFSNAGGCLAGGLAGGFQIDSGQVIGGFNRPELPPGQHDRQVLTIQAGTKTSHDSKTTPGSPTPHPTGRRIPHPRNQPKLIDLAQGSHYLYCSVNAGQAMFDTDVNMQNNMSPKVALTVTKTSFNKPDFQVQRVEFGTYYSAYPPDPAAIKAGSPVALWCWYRNLGVGFKGYPYSAKIRMLIDGQTVAEKPLPDMPQGAGPTTLVFEQLQFKAVGVGSHTCTCVADPDGVVPELDEKNNTATLPFTVVP